MKINSHSLIFRDFKTDWYSYWAKELRQDSKHLDGHQLHANKFWQNAVMCQALLERKKLAAGNKGIGFGVGQERLPAVFAKHCVYVTATDQDIKTSNAKYWSERELADGVNSLNRLDICEPKKFQEYVEYKSLDMTKINAEFRGKYDFLWSNCSLGHLGSITRGLKFIEESLECLKPGGVAVHTTEVNVLSDEHTVTSGNTVIFRPRDIYKLGVKLVEQGYNFSPLNFNLGQGLDDYRISLQPKFGNDYSKIQVGGHICTQVVIVITRPKKQQVSDLIKRKRLWRLKMSYRRALVNMKRYSHRNPNIKRMHEGQKLDLGLINIKPEKNTLSLNMKAGVKKELLLDFNNDSSISIYSAYGHILDTHPILLGATGPEDRLSKFADESWVAGTKNRASSNFQIKENGGKYRAVDHVEPGQPFAFKVMLNAKGVAKGKYLESFAVLQEGVRWIDGSEIKIAITVF